MATLSPLIGRAEELGLVEKLVQEHRLVTVTGAAGVGKTRLVEELRAHLAAAGDRVIPVRLDDLPAGSGADAIAGEAGMSSPEALALASAGERILVVLDGCDHVLAGAVDLALRFCEATDAGAVLTTSRQPLGVAGERVVVLDPLGVPTPADPDPEAAPAVALFFELVTASDARWDRSDRTVQAVAELCRAVDGLPLAIELAAARARTLSPTELLELVTQRTDTLRPPGGARSGGPPSIDASIALSVQLLDDDQHEVFRRLGVLTGAFDLGLVHAVAGPVVDDHLRAVELVGALVDRSLVVAEPSTGEHPVPDAPGRARARARRPDRRRARGGDPRAPGVGDGRGGDRHPRRGQPAVVRRPHRAHHHPRRQLHRVARVVHRERRRPRARLRPLRPAVRARPAEGHGRAGHRVRPLRPLARRPRRRSAPKPWR